MKKILSVMLVLSLSVLLSACKEENPPTAVVPDDVKKMVANLQEELKGKNIWTKDDPVWGQDTAPIEMVVFSDFQCPFCSDFYVSLERLQEDWVDTGKLKIQHRDFPLSMHFNSVPAHRAASAAFKQGKYIEMHRLLFQNQFEWEESLSPEKLFEKYAQELGLNMDQYKKDAADLSLADEIQEDRTAGKAAGVSGTPGFFVNGVSYDGAVSYEELITILKKQ